MSCSAANSRKRAATFDAPVTRASKSRLACVVSQRRAWPARRQAYRGVGVVNKWLIAHIALKVLIVAIIPHKSKTSAGIHHFGRTRRMSSCRPKSRRALTSSQPSCMRHHRMIMAEQRRGIVKSRWRAQLKIIASSPDNSPIPSRRILTLRGAVYK